MPGVDNLIFSASVLDNFSDTLNELQQDILMTQAVEEEAFPIHADMDIGEAMAKIALLTGAIEGVGDIDVDTDVDSGFGVAGGFGGGDGLDMPSRADIMGGDRSLGSTWRAFSQHQLRMSTLMSLIAALAPLLGVFVGALPAAIGGLVALAAAAVAAAAPLAAIGGLGFLGMALQGGEISMAPLRERLREVADTFLEAFGPIAEAFEPLMERGLVLMEQMFRDMASRANVLMRLTEDMAGAMDFLARTTGPALEAITRFGIAAMPLISGLVQFFIDVDWLRTFSNMLIDTMPLLFQMGRAFWNLLGPLFELSLGFMAVATSIITAFSWFLQLLDTIPFALEGFGLLIATYFTLLTATSLWTLATNSATLQMLNLALTTKGRVLPAIYTYLTSVLGATAGTWAFYAALAAVVGLVTFGIVPAISSMVGGFGILDSNIMSATRSLQEFNRVGNRASGMEFGADGATYNRGPGYSRPGAPQAVVAVPDDETANQVNNTARFSATTSSDSVEDRQHSGQ